jgi:hsp70-interacting protein
MADGGTPWAWLGLLKWSLSYADGTTSSKDDMVPMSIEDRKFLETVMAEGIIDENARMKFVLQEAAKAMEYYKTKALGDREIVEPPISDDALVVLLQEVRDIVEQIDYARAFCSLQGLPFLIGCIEEREGVPEKIRMMCTGILSTVCQNNPPVQKQLLELGAIKSLSGTWRKQIGLTRFVFPKFKANVQIFN